LRVRALGLLPVQALEFTLAALFSRLRYVSGGSFAPQLLGLPMARPANDEVRSRLYGLEPAYQHPCAEMLIDAATWQLPTHSADAFLHATLKGMAAQLQLAQAGDSTLERALRVRLRDALAQGRADASRMAELLGVSERTLKSSAVRRLPGCWPRRVCIWSRWPVGWAMQSRPRSRGPSDAGRASRLGLGGPDNGAELRGYRADRQVRLATGYRLLATRSNVGFVAARSVSRLTVEGPAAPVHTATERSVAQLTPASVEP
jgi:hypothetical protein